MWALRPNACSLLCAVRIGLVLAAALGASLVATGAAHAQYLGRSAWCANVRGDAYECYYRTFEQCWARASGFTNACVVNPWYVAEPQRTRRPPRSSRR